jgi:D-alanine-D-alanine ligase
MKKFGKVAVLMGGQNAERDISLKSGEGVLNALIQSGVDAHKVDVGHDIKDVLSQGHFDRAFIMLHGRGGEDGEIQSLLTELAIPFTGSDEQASALAMDKWRTKTRVSAQGILTPPAQLIHSKKELLALGAVDQYPLAIKPVHEGSSNGVSKVMRPSELDKAYALALKYQDLVMAETWIEGDEYAVTIVGEQIFPCAKVSTPTRDFYDYQAKYYDHSTLYECPSDLSSTEEAALQKTALQVFQLLGCRHWARVDFIRQPGGELYFIELNTIPGMTETSLVPKSALAAGLDYQQLVLRILTESCSL